MHRFLGGRPNPHWPIAIRKDFFPSTYMVHMKDARSANKIVAPLLIIAICKTITTLTFRVRKTFPAADDDDDRDGLV